MPSDNPFVGKRGSRPEIYTIGHRDHHGIAANPATGQIFHLELGPLGGDKINILKAGGNYGWPTYGYGRDNDGSPMLPPSEGIEQAWITWNPGITPSGLLFYTGDRFPRGRGTSLSAASCAEEFPAPATWNGSSSTTSYGSSGGNRCWRISISACGTFVRGPTA